MLGRSHVKHNNPVYMARKEIFREEVSQLRYMAPQEIAAQLMVIENEYFLQIKPDELVMGRWRKSNKDELAPNVIAFISWFNRTTNWIITEIVTALTVKQRAKIIERFIEIGEYSISINNANTAMEVVSALNQGPVYRLKQSWEEISEKHKESWAKVKDFMSPDSNYAKLRELMKNWKEDEDRLPYVGLLLQDLIACEEIPTKTAKKLINFQKMRQISKIIKYIRSFQVQVSQNSQNQYNPTNDYVREYLTSDELVILEEKDQYKFSRLCEQKKEV